MDKIFKRVPRETTRETVEGAKERRADGLPTGTTPETGPEQSSREHKSGSSNLFETVRQIAAEGPKPKFAWNSRSQNGARPVKTVEPEPKEIPDDLWIKCTHCKELIYRKEYENNKKVCHKCGHHFRLGAAERLALLLDEGSFEEINARLVTSDPLQFTSLAEPPYYLKSEQTRHKTGLNEAIITGTGLLEQMPLAIAVCDFGYQGGSMGSVFGEKLARLVEEAILRRLPVLTVSASGGARMHEGMFSLMQMAKTTAALAKLSEARLPHFSLLTDPCTGGVIASYASVADVVIAEPGALIGFAGPRVIEQITKQKLPPGFQTAEFLLEHGMIDQVVARKELRTTLASLLKFYRLAAARVQPSDRREVSYAR